MLGLTLHHIVKKKKKKRYARILTYGIDYSLSLSQNINFDFQFKWQKILSIQLTVTHHCIVCMCANGTDTLWYPTFRFLYIYIYKLMVRYWSVIRLRQQQPAIEHPLSPEVPINHLQNDQKSTLYIVINYL